MLQDYQIKIIHHINLFFQWILVILFFCFWGFFGESRNWTKYRRLVMVWKEEGCYRLGEF